VAIAATKANHSADRYIEVFILPPQNGFRALWGKYGCGLEVDLGCRRVSKKGVREHGDMLSYPVFVKQGLMYPAPAKLNVRLTS
jgi:hypothetical protein